MTKHTKLQNLTRIKNSRHESKLLYITITYILWYVITINYSKYYINFEEKDIMPGFCSVSVLYVFSQQKISRSLGKYYISKQIIKW